MPAFSKKGLNLPMTADASTNSVLASGSVSRTSEAARPRERNWGSMMTRAMVRISLFMSRVRDFLLMAAVYRWLMARFRKRFSSGGRQ